MATLEQLSAALVKADAAGNTADAKVFADAIRAMKGIKSTGSGLSQAAMDQTSVNDLPFPGNTVNPFDPVKNAPKPNMDSPVDALNTYGQHLASSVPIIGPTLQNMGENADAALDNLLYRPMQGLPGTTTREDVAGTNQQLTQANPQAATAGDISGPVGAYLLASRIPGGAKALGLEGTIMSRLGLGAASQYGINTADNIAHGEPVDEALKNAILPTAIAAPFSLFGKGAPKAPTEREMMADILTKEGVPLTAGQTKGSKWLRYRESELGGNAAQDFTENQAKQFTRATLEKAGVKSDVASPDVIKQAFDNIGQEFDDLGARNVLVPDKQFGTDLKAALTNYQDIKAGSQQAPIVGNIVTDIAKRIIQGGTIDGAWYKATRSRLGRVASKTSDPELKGALMDINHALDDAMERSIATTNPSDLGAWKEVRRRYRNLLVVEDAASGAGENAALGNISPAKLRQAIVKIEGKRGWTRGKSDFEELARAGNATMTPLPDSGTASRIAARLAPAGIGIATGGALGSQGGGIGTLAGMAAGAVAPWALGRALLSDPGRKLFTKGIPSSAVPSLLARALIGQGMQ